MKPQTRKDKIIGILAAIWGIGSFLFILLGPGRRFANRHHIAPFVSPPATATPFDEALPMKKGA